MLPCWWHLWAAWAAHTGLDRYFRMYNTETPAPSARQAHPGRGVLQPGSRVSRLGGRPPNDPKGGSHRQFFSLN